MSARAAKCKEHCGYHITAENIVMGFVKDNEPVDEGESGAILLTGLRNYGMPFIRYEIGDVGVPSDEICRCGLGLPLMKSLRGRKSQILRIRDASSQKITSLDASVVEHIVDLLKSRARRTNDTE